MMTDFSVAKSNAETKKRIADMLMKYSQGAIPEGQFTKIKPAQALVKGLESFGAAYLAASGAKDAAKIDDDRRNALVQVLKGGGQLTPDSMIEYGASPDDIMAMQLKRQFTPKQIESTNQGLAMIDPLNGDLSYVKDPTTGKVVSRATADPLLQALITRGREGEKGVELTNPYGQPYRAPQKQANPAFGDFTQNAQPNVQQPVQPKQPIQPSQYDSLIESSAQKYGLDPNLLRAMMKQESGGNPTALSSAGAAGLMQLMPATAQRFGVTDRNDPAQSVDGGAQYMRFLLDKFNGDTALALAGYNAGEGAVDKHGGIPPYKETQNYVRSILGNYQPSQPPTQQVAQADNVQNDGIVYGQSPAEKAAQSAAATLPYDVAKKQAEGEITTNNAIQTAAAKAEIENKQKLQQDVNQKTLDANSTIEILNQVEPLLDTATGSTFGNMYDQTLGAFGVGTTGAIDAGSLKILGGYLQSKVPKMSGPQSDKDAAMYAQMAGSLADPTIPNEVKKKNVQTMRVLNAKYANLNQTNTPEQDNPKTAPQGVKFLGFE